MRRPVFLNALLCASVVASASASAQQFTKPGPISKLAAPVLLDTTAMFLAKFASVGDDFFIAGQPTQRALREMRDRGVTTVVNLRMPDEMARIGFDEAALVAELGMRYVHIPVRSGTSNPYSPETVTKFTEAMSGANGKVLLHCTVAWRASHLWAAYLIRERAVPLEDALANARAINLMDAHRMSDGRQPVEEFLNRALPTLGKTPE